MQNIEGWKEFELLTKQIQETLTPEAVVTHNETLVGKSGSKNQIDICLRSKVGQFSFFCIFECKDTKEKVDIKTVRAFKSTIEDVEAQQGVIVSREGFTSEAVTYAKSNNILLYTLVNAQNENWSKAPLVPIVVRDIRLENATAKYIGADGAQIGLVDQDGKPAPEDKTYFFDIKKKRYVLIRRLLEEKWDEIFREREPAPDEIFKTDIEDYCLYEGNNKNIPVVLEYSLEACKRWHYGHVSVQNCLGFYEQETEKLHTNEYVAEAISLKNVFKNWPYVEDPNDIPVKSEHVFLAGYFFTGAEGKEPISDIEIRIIKKPKAS